MDDRGNERDEVGCDRRRDSCRGSRYKQQDQAGYGAGQAAGVQTAEGVNLFPQPKDGDDGAFGGAGQPNTTWGFVVPRRVWIMYGTAAANVRTAEAAT